MPKSEIPVSSKWRRARSSFTMRTLQFVVSVRREDQAHLLVCPSRETDKRISSWTPSWNAPGEQMVIRPAHSEYVTQKGRELRTSHNSIVSAELLVVFVKPAHPLLVLSQG
jgi:hypothetical protein